MKHILVPCTLICSLHIKVAIGLSFGLVAYCFCFAPLSILYSTNCSKCNGVLADTDYVKCSICSKPFHIACTFISGLTGNNLETRCTTWLCTACELTQLENQLSDTKSSNYLADETVISEVIDRQARSRNLIVFNAAESDENNEDDMSISILHSITPNTAPALVSRLGQKQVNLVTLIEPSDVFIVLKNKHKLHTSSTYSSIRISPDRTIMQ
ncbi:Reverse transcriptase domain-containing protein [Aphis craccivora]|uniref:Reverse transcriptase domain-containing protein n=1 Tax=Aphis craccivora TaxID=307492 RepID=A0A6G0Y8W8_APHCR|nr:Reverse transcriptase domain-containing protein [Aphis craccivora]